LQHHRLAPALLNLNLRVCQAGESNTTATQSSVTSGDGSGSIDVESAVAASLLAPCQACRQGSVSLDPNAAGGCILCANADHANW
jgi:hypothetical protein